MSAIGAVVARFVHTEEVTGSNPVSRTSMESSDVRSGDFLYTRGRTSDLLGLMPSARERFIGASRARKILPLAGSNPVSRTSMESSDVRSGDFLYTRGRTSDLLGLMPSARERFIGASRARKILPLAGSNPVSRTSMESSDVRSGDFLYCHRRT